MTTNEVNITYNENALTGISSRLEPNTISMCVTSPPYYMLRDYKVPKTYWPACKFALLGFERDIPEWTGCLGLEPTPDMYVAHLVLIFNEVFKVLKDNGTLWLNIGDTFSGSMNGNSKKEKKQWEEESKNVTAQDKPSYEESKQRKRKAAGQIAPKNLFGIPWMVAFALREAGWNLRMDIIWHKLNPMPESVKSRPSKAHEYIFLLSKSSKYYYDHKAIMEPVALSTQADKRLSDPNYKPGRPQRDYIKQASRGAGLLKPASWKGSSFDKGKTGEAQDENRNGPGRRSGNKERKQGSARMCPEGTGSNVASHVPWEGEWANKKSVWSISSKPFPEAHFATFPEDIPEICIKAGCPTDGIVMDCFSGSGKTNATARRLNRGCVSFDIDPKNVAMSERMMNRRLGMFKDVFKVI